ncbi:biotin transporter BioY [Pseudolysinimonas sp.]|uniref:biotin transporter BioY n=1 Tax=Pseudolysinimonas sp. TaxID=2680009 RepID=UPI003F81290B
MTIAVPARRLVLADRVLPRSLAGSAILVIAGTALVSVLAQVAIPLWPVPITGQTFAVLLVGAVLGPVRGAISMALYLVLGALGLPIFTGGAHGDLVALPSGGYIVGFIVAAALVGFLARRRWDRRWYGTVVAFLAGSAVMYAFGLPWLFASMVSLHQPDALGFTIQHGLLVFLIGDAIKAAVAGVLLPLAWKAAGRLDTRS